MATRSVKRNGLKLKSARLILAAMLAATLSVTLGGCQTATTATTTKALCEPWKPVSYNSRERASKRYAGPLLAHDLAVHNRTGENIGCWQ